MIALFASAALALPGAPDPLTVGFGVGIVAPSASLAPNVASVRLRVTDGLTLSPTFGYTYATSRTGTGEDEAWTVTRAVDLGIGAEALGAVAQRGSALLQVVGGASFGANTSTTNPDEPLEVRTEVRSFSVYYGLGVEWFLGATDPHVSLSAHGLNPLVNVSRVRVLDESTSPIQTDSTSIGLVWDPTVRLMVHLYL